MSLSLPHPSLKRHTAIATVVSAIVLGLRAKFPDEIVYALIGFLNVTVNYCSGHLDNYRFVNVLEFCSLFLNFYIIKSNF